MVKRRKSKKKNDDKVFLIILGIVFLIFFLNQSGFFSVFPASDGFLYYGEADLDLSGFGTPVRYVVPNEDTWKYSHTLNSGWTSLSFNDSSWATDDTFEKWAWYMHENAAGCRDVYSHSCQYTPNPCTVRPGGVASVQCDCSYRVSITRCEVGIAECETKSNDGVRGDQHCAYPAGNNNWPNAESLYLRKVINVPEGDIYRSYMKVPPTFTCYVNGDEIAIPTGSYRHPEITNSLKNGENVIACTSSNTGTGSFSTNMYIYYSIQEKVSQKIITQRDRDLGMSTRTTDMPQYGNYIKYTSNLDYAHNNYWAFIYGTRSDTSTKYTGPGISDVTGTERDIRLYAFSGGSSYTPGSANAVTTKDINSWDFKTELIFNSDPSNSNWVPKGGFSVGVTDKAGHSQGLFSVGPSVKGNFDDGGLLNIKRGIINDQLVRVEYKGFEVTEFNWPYESMYVTFSVSATGDGYDGVSTTSTLDLKNTRYQPLFDCEMDSGDLLIMEPISGPTAIDIHSLSYEVKKFCLAHPAYVVDATKSASGANAEIYQELVQARPVDIPSDQIWVLFYIMDNSEQIIPSQCSTGELYSTQSLSCVGVAAICPSGYDIVTGTCATTVEVITQQCEVNSDCPTPCPGITSSCVANTCEFSGSCDDNLVVPQICIDEGITDSQACVDWLDTNVGLLEGTVQDKINYINLLNIDLADKEALVAQLTNNINEQVALISQLDLTVSEQAQVIDDFQLTIEEQQAYINSLDLSVREQADLIQALDLEVQDQAILIDAFELTITEQNDLISQLSLTVSQKQILLTELQQTVNDQNQQIANFEATIDLQVTAIEALELTVDEQAVYINELDLNIEIQAGIIDQLEQNLATKILLIGKLQATTEEQAALIAEMELSFAEQAAIISALGDTIEDDAALINALNLAVTDQAQIINNMQLTLDEQASLISAMQLTNEQQGLLLAEMQLTVEEQALIIADLEYQNAYQAEIINSMDLSTQEQGELIAALTQNNEDMAEIIINLDASIEESAEIIAAMKLTNEDQARLIIEMQLNTDEQATIIGNLKATIEEQKVLIAELKALEPSIDDDRIIELLEEKYKDQQRNLIIAFAVVVGILLLAIRRRS